MRHEKNPSSGLPTATAGSTSALMGLKSRATSRSRSKSRKSRPGSSSSESGSESEGEGDSASLSASVYERDVDMNWEDGNVGASVEMMTEKGCKVGRMPRRLKLRCRSDMSEDSELNERDNLPQSVDGKEIYEPDNMASTSVQVPLNLPPPSPILSDTVSESQIEGLATVNDLPHEILTHIFHIYMFWEEEPDHLDPELEGMVSVFLPNPRSAPLLFCNVCSYWRNVAIVTPALWSAIVIRKGFNLDTVALWLQRSQNHPLSLFIAIGLDPFAHIREPIPRLMEILYATTSRWQNVSMHLPTSNDIREFLSIVIPAEGESPAVRLQLLRLSAGAGGCKLNIYPDIASDSAAERCSLPHPTLLRLAWDNPVQPDFTRLSPALCTVDQRCQLQNKFLWTCSAGTSAPHRTTRRPAFLPPRIISSPLLCGLIR
ncbi:hypothetical protein CVT24_002604 [Panaeolus cyanescens]|uniref:Uncharacterized protein n=1 Tax=Panaeolus cyanescens TaxID=181874 RepID=A0A409X1X9_9AGAR|nr:hypothetical protein CVT24_002604 [Panaeolus cyanescens]